ncbi:hypothetical protein CWN03_25195, partial [Klebsiella quasipneumoniae]
LWITTSDQRASASIRVIVISHSSLSIPFGSGKTAIMFRSRHYPDWRNAVLPDIITVQITRGQCDRRFCSRRPASQSHTGI